MKPEDSGSLIMRATRVRIPMPEGAAVPKGSELPITRREAMRLMKLLGKLQEFLETNIDGAVTAGGSETHERWLRAAVKRDQADVREAEDWVMRLEAFLRSGKNGGRH